MKRKGIILAGGKGTRLKPLTSCVCKPLLPVYDKPMIYYSLSVLMHAGIREIAIITTPEDQHLFQRLLGDGSQWGVRFEWILQHSADGIAHAYILAEEFLEGQSSALVLGDNLFLGQEFSERLKTMRIPTSGGTVFTIEVDDPQRFGVVALEGDRVTQIIEKPAIPPSKLAVTGLYFLDGDAPRRARALRPSERFELEIVSLLETYLEEGTLGVQRLEAGLEWYDAGTHDALLEAGMAVQRLQRDGILYGSPEEAAFRQGWRSLDGAAYLVGELGKTAYGRMLAAVINVTSLERSIAVP